MKRQLFSILSAIAIIFAVLMLTGCSLELPFPGETPNDPSAVNVNFVMINDTHGAFTDSNTGYSIGRVDTLVELLEITNGDYVFIHNGDAFQGS